MVIILVFLSAHPAFAESILQKMSKSEDKDSVQVFLSFDQAPRFESKITGKRLNIVLRNTKISESIKMFPENDKVIKILTRPHRDATIISLFFRYQPQKVALTPSGANTIVADILLGNRYSGTYENLSTQLQGVTLLDRKTEDFTNPLVASPYAHDWRTFFSDYESEVHTHAPVKIYVPEFPIIRLMPTELEKNLNLLPEEVLLSADQGAWSSVVSFLQEELAKPHELETKKILALTFGEALMHTESFSDAYKQLYLLREKYPDEQVGIFASFLLSLLIATYDDPYSADFQLKELSAKIRKDNPLTPYLQIAIAETCLATDQIDRLNQILTRDDIGYPAEIEYRRELRQSDYLYASGKPVKAYVSYQLVSKNTDLNLFPYSLNGYCTTLYNQASFEKSADCYLTLSDLLDDRTEIGKVYFRTAMSKLKLTDDPATLVSEFSRIEDAFPGTEAGYRAALKKTDIQYLSRIEWSDTAVKYYHVLAEKSIYRAVSEEAYFKEALLYHISGNNSKSIELLMTLLRNFRTGPIRQHAEALLIQLLPDELKKLVEEKDYTAALTLARQNRRFFENNWIDISILSDLAYSYRQLGIFSDSMRLYQYLSQISGIEKKEHYFLPMAEIAFDMGDYDLVEDYATQYLYYYPDGNYLNDIIYLRIHALFISNEIEEAIQLLPDPLPETDNYRFLAANLYFRKDKYSDSVSILSPLWDAGRDLPANILYIFAESLYLAGDFDRAIPVYQMCRNYERFSGQSIYRLAEMSKRRGEEDTARELFSEIVENGKDSLWKKYAERELELDRINDNL